MKADRASSPVTVLHMLESAGPGGAENMLLALARGLDRRRFRPLVALLRDGWLSARLRDAGIPTYVLSRSNDERVRPLWSLVRLVVTEDARVLHGHEFAMNVYGSVAARLTRRPIVTTVHGKHYFPARARRRVLYRWVSRVSTMVAVSQELRAFLATTLRRPERCFGVVWNGIEAGAFEGPQDVDRVRAGLGIPPGAVVVGAVGNLYPVKDYPVFLAAARLIVRAVPNVIFLVVGRGSLLEALQRLASELGVADRVRFLGFRPDVARLLHLMDVFVLSSLSEGLSLSLLEAMAAGRPVVATDVGGNREVVADGETGYLVPAGDAAAIAAAVERVLRRRDEAVRLGAAGRRRVERLFSADAMCRTYERLYESLVL